MKLERMLNGIKGKVDARVLGTYLGLAAAVLGCKEKSGGGGFYIPPSPNPTPTNSTPVITSNPLITTIDEKQGWNYDVDATDADGDVLNYALTQSPAGMTINAGSGIINWIDSEDGVHPVGVQVSDGKGGIANQNFNLTVNNKFDDLSGKVRDILSGNLITTGADVHLAHKDANGDILTDFATRSDANGNYLILDVPTGVARLVLLDSPNHFLNKSGTLTSNQDIANLDFELIPNTYSVNFFNEVARNPVDGGQTQRWLNRPEVYINTSPALGSGTQPTQQEIDLAENIFRNEIPVFNNGFTGNNINITVGTNPPASNTPGFIIFRWDDSTGALGVHGELLNGNEIINAICAVRTGLNGSQQLYVNRQEIAQTFGVRNDSNLEASIFNDPQTLGIDNFQQIDLDTGKILYKRPTGNKTENVKINGILRTILDSNPDNTPVQ